ALALFSSVPLLIGALAQIFTPYWVGLLGSRKRLVLVAASSQALANLFFWWIASQGSASLATFLTAKILYWTSGMALMPAWSAWLGSLTTDLNRERFFAWRSALGQAALLIAYGVGGLILEHGRRSHHLFLAFSTSYM